MALGVSPIIPGRFRSVRNRPHPRTGSSILKTRVVSSSRSPPGSRNHNGLFLNNRSIHTILGSLSSLSILLTPSTPSTPSIPSQGR